MDDVLDLHHLARQTFGDLDLALELLGLLDGQIARLVPFVGEPGPVPARRDAAHTLKGAARAVGAFAFGDAAAAVEEALAEGGPGPSPEVMAALAEAGARVRSAVAAMQRGDLPLAFPSSLA